MMRPPSTARTVIYVQDSLTKEPLVGATVRIVSGKDTLAYATVKNMVFTVTSARCECFRRFRHPVELTVSFMGYKPFSKRYEAKDFVGNIDVNLAEDERQIAAVEVRGDRIAMIIRGDTTVYDAAAFKTLPGDRLGELLKQLPGIEVRDGSIFANGAEIKRVYVDGQTFFGDDTKAALRDLTTEDIKDVKVYDEDNPVAKRIGDTRAPKDKVMDVTTKSKPKIIKNIMLAASGGVSTQTDYNGKHTARHDERAVVSLNTPRNSMSLMAYNGSNAARRLGIDVLSIYTPPTPFRYTEINGSYSHRKGDSLKYGINVSIYLDRSETEQQSMTDYFPTEVYEIRRVESQSKALTKNNTYDLGGMFTHARGRHILQTRIKGSYGTQMGRTTNGSTDRTDGNTVSQLRRTRSDGDSRKLEASVSYSQGFNNDAFITASASADYSNNDRDGWEIDTLGTTSFRTNLRNHGDGSVWNVQGQFGFSKDISKVSTIRLNYEFDYRNERSKQRSVDFLNDPLGALDLLNTYDYTVNASHNTLTFNYTFRPNRKVRLDAGIGGNATVANRDERLPHDVYTPRTFWSVIPRLDFSYNFTPQKSLSLRAQSRVDDISLEQLRGVIDTRNPLLLRVGNPDLKQPLKTDFSLVYNQQIAERSFNWAARFDGSHTLHYIADKTTYFTEETPLPEYDYTAQRGATLSTFDNAGGYLNLNASLSMSKQFKAVRTTIRSKLEYGYSQVPFFLNGVARTTDQHYMGLMLHLIGGFSSHVTPEIRCTARIGEFASGPYGKSRYLDAQINGSLRSRFAEKYEAKAIVFYSLYRNDVSKQAARDAVYCNVEIGRKFGAKNRLGMLTGVVDIFNQGENRRTQVVNDYISTSQTSLLGRYWFLEVSYTF
ncbi:peptidase associated domain and porin domain-containing protein [Alistipes timonensis]|nr:TonB-dependent receptor [Alistipes timonensis]